MCRPLTEFNDRELISDYRFLEEVGRAGEAAFRGQPEGTGSAPPERVRSLLKAVGISPAVALMFITLEEC